MLFRSARLIQSMVGNAAGITGTVTISLLDGQLTAESRVELGLGYESEYLLDTVVVGAGGTPGQWAVRLRNRIESPVRIEECRAFTLPTGVLAMPLAETVPVGTTLNPNQAVDVVYQLQPADAMLVAETLPVRATPIPDAAVLLGMLVLPGGGAATPSKVTVNARFPTTPDAEPIVGLKVEFDDESEVTLTPSSPSAEVTLAGRILDVALGRSPEFFYRVQNLHPTRGGAATGWTKAAVGVPLTISWVVATIAESF